MRMIIYIPCLTFRLSSIPIHNIPLPDSRNDEYVCLLLRKFCETSKDKPSHGWDLRSMINLKGIVWCCDSQGSQHQKRLKLAITFPTTLNIRRVIKLLSPFLLLPFFHNKLVINLKCQCLSYWDPKRTCTLSVKKRIYDVYQAVHMLLSTTILP